MLLVLIKKYFLLPLALFIVAGLLGYEAQVYLSNRLSYKEVRIQHLKDTVKVLDREIDFLFTQYRYYLKYGDQYKVLSHSLVRPLDRLKFSDIFYRLSIFYDFPGFSLAFNPVQKATGLRVRDTSIRNGLIVIHPIQLRWSSPSDLDYVRIIRFLKRRFTPYLHVVGCDLASNSTEKSTFSTSISYNRHAVSAECRIVLLNAQPQVYRREHD